MKTPEDDDPKAGAIHCIGAEPCVHQDECRLHKLCLGSDEGIAYQERGMKAFFEGLFPQFIGWKP